MIARSSFYIDELSMNVADRIYNAVLPCIDFHAEQVHNTLLNTFVNPFFRWLIVVFVHFRFRKNFMNEFLLL